jgi:hypothetical protein
VTGKLLARALGRSVRWTVENTTVAWQQVRRVSKTRHPTMLAGQQYEAIEPPTINVFTGNFEVEVSKVYR